MCSREPNFTNFVAQSDNSDEEFCDTLDYIFHTHLNGVLVCDMQQEKLHKFFFEEESANIT